MRIRAYSGPLTVMAMGTLGFSLFCIVSAIALAGADQEHPVSIAPQNIVDSAFSNINTMAALTVEVISQYVFTPTATPTLTSSIVPAASSSTSTSLTIPTRTPFPPTRTRGPGIQPATLTATHVPPSPTQIPSQTFTPVPPTSTPRPPPDTDTPVPPDTNTPQPPPTSEPPTATEPPTQPPVDTATSAPVVAP